MNDPHTASVVPDHDSPPTAAAGGDFADLHGIVSRAELLRSSGYVLRHLHTVGAPLRARTEVGGPV